MITVRYSPLSATAADRLRQLYLSSEVFFIGRSWVSSSLNLKPTMPLGTEVHKILRKVSSHLLLWPNGNTQGTGAQVQSTSSSVPSRKSALENDSSALDSVNPSPPIPDNMLAFRTITTLLAEIQDRQEVPFLVLDMVPSEVQQAQLNILEAIANVAVTDTDIIAVVSKGGPGSSSSSVDLLVSTLEAENEDDPPSLLDLPPSLTSTTPASGLIRRFWNLIASLNPNNDKKTPTTDTTPSSIPIIIQPATIISDGSLNQRDYMANAW